MGRAKRQAKPKQPVAANDPTPERMARDDFEVVQAVRMPGEQLGANGVATTARRQASRVLRMQKEGWITRNEAAALVRYEGMIEAAGYGGGRSCLDNSPSSGGGLEGAIDKLAGARLALGKVHNAVEGPDGRGVVPLLFVKAVLAPYGSETITDVMDRQLRGPRADRREMARLYCAFVAGRLVTHFGA